MLRAVATIWVLQFVTMLFQLVRTKLLALLLGPDLVGAMSVIDKLLAVIAQTISLSLPFAALRFLPERWSADKEGAAYRDLFERMRNLILALALGATALALAVTLIRPAVWGAQLVPYREAVAAAVLTIPVVAIIPFLQNAVAGRMEQNRSMLVVFLNAVALAVAAAGVWRWGVPGYYGAYAVLGLGLVIWIGSQVTRGTARPAAVGPRPRRFQFGLPRQVWQFSGALLTIAFLSPYAALFLHYRVLRDHGTTAAGWMAAAWGVAFSVRAVLGTAHTVFLNPNVNRGGSPADRMAWANRYQAAFCLLAGLAVPPILLFPQLVVRLLYSSAFLPGAAFLAAFVVVEVSYVLSGAYQALILAFDRLKVQVAVTLGAQLAVIAAASQLIGPLGIFGAALAGFAAPLFLGTATMTFLSRSYGLRVPGRLVIRGAWLLIGLVGAGVVGVKLQASLWPSLAIKAGVYGVIVGGFALLLADEERRAARETIAAWRARLFPVPS
jgi:O-antigen/teichoic acid export membrane protein